MAKKFKRGTLSTRASADKKTKPAKESNVVGKIKILLGSRKLRISGHANERMGERGVIYFEILQALSSGKHDPGRDRYSSTYKSWEYSIEGKTNDQRVLRIGISFEVVKPSDELIVVVTVVDPKS